METRNTFEVVSNYRPTGDQPQAIERLASGIAGGLDMQTLLGVTGSGKTHTMARVIEKVGKPALVMAHNKTLAAQLASEFGEFFPNNAVEYFVSYYDYYQPEAYVPSSDTFIEKDAQINEDIDRLRHSATSSLFTRSDVIVVASVSAIYGLGSPEEYRSKMVVLREGGFYDLDDVLRDLVKIQYARNDYQLARGNFRVRGDVLEIQPAYQDTVYRVSFFGDEVEGMAEVDPLTGEVLREHELLTIYPATHFVTDEDRMKVATANIEAELEERYAELESQGKVLEAYRLRQRTQYDLEMMRELGYCSGIENYSRHMDGRPPGSTPYTLLDYFPDDYVTFIDESHITLPQIRGMYNGDQSRKGTLVEHGFRLPSAKDNRPLTFDEFLLKSNQLVFVSATPGPYELENSGQIVEQIIRPTGLLDPPVDVRPTKGQIDDLMNEVAVRVEHGERVLITTLTIKMAEDLTDYLLEHNVKTRYMHSNIETLDRIQIIRGLRTGEFDVLVGINLLREGLDLPEVTLVAILDADKEGFLRGERALIQTIGRAARNAGGRVIMYADKETDAMRAAIGETNRRREIQKAYNERNGITPTTIAKGVSDILIAAEAKGLYKTQRQKAAERNTSGDPDELRELIANLEAEMMAAAEDLKFEYAAKLRDEIKDLERQLQEATS
ncbi:excinuclease ABC subunit UvrB [Rubrobacter radiotolerans]|uniref:excinuclease ABC subunit UvrB n=1 Tax=Rubrobacter radiotolerans TaxID=42256 RepID=UPI000571F663|nr:excinuclease ABC subunit UvrB [Rubrobacter radiotolerans]SMC06110.1 Excinuclease ABC subunit B [Rubrobacter radiotolerans DSM 5868]